MLRIRKALAALGGRKIYVDLGTENTLIYLKGSGLILNQPSLIAFRNGINGKYEIATGDAAKAMLGRTPDNVSIVRPLREGVIADFDAAVIMLRSFLKKSLPMTSWFKSELILSLPCRASDYERQALHEITRSLNISKTYLVDEPVLAALGSELPVSAPMGSMVIDIGGGTTEIAIMSFGGVVYSCAVRVGGYEMDQKIIDSLRSTFNFLIGEPTAEQLKIQHGCVYNPSTERDIDVKGVNLTSGMPGTLRISQDDLSRALEPTIRAIIDAAKLALGEASPELSSDLVATGLTLTGGVASLGGLADRMREELDIFVHVSDEPMLSVGRGGGVLLERPDLLEMMAHF